MRFPVTLLAILFALFAAGCVTSRDYLGQGDSGETLHLKRGETIKLRLAGNPAGGRTWVITHLDSNVVKQRGEPEVEVGMHVGALARMYFYNYKFRAEARGNTLLRMELRSQEQPELPAAEVFELTLIVE